MAEIENKTPEQIAAEEFLKDKTVIGVSRKISGLHYDTAVIGRGQTLQEIADEAIRQVHAAAESEGRRPIEDVLIQVRVSVMTEPLPEVVE